MIYIVFRVFGTVVAIYTGRTEKQFTKYTYRRFYNDTRKILSQACKK